MLRSRFHHICMIMSPFAVDDTKDIDMSSEKVRKRQKQEGRERARENERNGKK